jgi:cobalt-zinc-cadmium efflux system membrane fusion protein
MLASMDIQLGSPESRLAIPDSAIIYEDGLAHVWVVNEQKQLQYRTIEVGVRESGWVAVIKGLKGGEKIVTRGGIFIDRSVDTSGQKS